MLDRSAGDATMVRQLGCSMEGRVGCLQEGRVGCSLEGRVGCSMEGRMGGMSLQTSLFVSFQTTQYN
jgi:hypothetical protein